LLDEGYNLIYSESIPFHVLFGTFLYPIITDPYDTRTNWIGFGGRTNPSQLINMFLPEGFGTEYFGLRKKQEVHDYFTKMDWSQSILLETFDRLQKPSTSLREYLWAHEQGHIQIARKLISILSPLDLRKILEYLIEDYWHRYLGWPDMVVFNDIGFFFAEVKSSSDKLSLDQRRWIQDNFKHLHFPFKLIKIHKANVVDS
jgi:hypothetical protein